MAPRKLSPLAEARTRIYNERFVVLEIQDGRHLDIDRVDFFKRAAVRVNLLCEACKGRGTTEHPMEKMRAKFSGGVDDVVGSMLTEDAKQKFQSGKTFDRIPCCECEGKGESTGLVSLLDILGAGFASDFAIKQAESR